MRWFWFACLTAAAAEDMGHRSISVRQLIVCGIFGFIQGWKTGIWNHWAGLLAGAAMVAASRLTEESIGSGDGWFILASAGYMETEEMLILLLGGFGISWIVSMGIILGRIRTGGKGIRTTIPLLACMWPAGLWILIRAL